jgi:hypothetical protein
MSLDPNQPKKTNCSGFLIVLLEKGRVAALVPFCSHHFHFFSSFLSGEEMSHTKCFFWEFPIVRPLQYFLREASRGYGSAINSSNVALPDVWGT